MNMELTVNDNSGRTMAEMMGVDTSAGPQKASSLARLNILHTALMGEVEVAGKLRNTEVLPVGTFSLKIGEDIIYVAKPSIRIFAMRQQYAKWDSENNKMDRTVLANDLKSDLKDSRGTFNLGRDSKYRTPEEWAALDEDYKARQSSVKNSKVLFGKVSMNKPFDAKGNPMQGYDGEIDFVYYVKNFQSKKSMDAALQEITAKKLLPIEHTIKLTSKKEKMSTNSYATVVASLGSKVSMKEDDQDTLRSFVDYIDNSNDYILSEWKKLNKPDVAISPDVLDAIVQVEEAPY